MPPKKAHDHGLWKKDAVIDNRYKVHGLAHGGMGEVYFVHDREIDRMMAVKTPLPSVMANPDGLNRFYREAEAWISLGIHPNICSAYYVAEVDGLPRLFIEYVDGGALDMWLKKGLLRGVTEKLDMAIQIASGMNWTHTFHWTDDEGIPQTGIVHRDLKPANILMSKYGMALITDFGLVGLGSWGKGEKLTIGEETSSMIDLLGADEALHEDMSNPWQTMTIGGVPFGTPQYMAPEQFKDAHTAGMPADIYAYGCILYELFCGRRPFMLTEEERQGMIYYQVMLWQKKHTNEPPPLPQKLTPGIDDELSSLMLQCLDKDRHARPADFAEIRDRLASIYARTIGTAYPRPEAKTSELQADSLNNQGVSYATIGQSNRAEEHWKKALEAAPEHVEAAFNQTIHAVKRGALKEDAAITKMDGYLQSLQHLGQGRYLMGKLHLFLGDEYTAGNIINEIFKEGNEPPEVKKIRALLIANRDTAKDDREHLIKARDCFNFFLVDNTSAPTTDTSGPTGAKSNTVSAKSSSTNAVTESLGAKPEPIITMGDPISAIGYCHCLSELGEDYSADYTKWRGHFKEIPESLPEAVYKYLPGFSLQRKYIDEFREPLSLALSKDGENAYAGMSDGRIHIYDLNSDAPISVFKEQKARVTAIDVSADKRFIAAGLEDGSVCVMDAANGQVLHSFKGHVKGITSVRFLPATIYVISASTDGSIRVWDTKNSKAVGAYKTDGTPVTALAVSPDLKYVYSSHKGGPPCKWETKTGKAALRFSGQLTGASAIAISADGAYAVTGSGKDPVVLWDTQTGKPTDQFRGHSAPVAFVGFSADGRFMVALDELTARVWDFRKTRLIHRIIKYRGPVRCGAISRSENKLIIGQGNEICLTSFENTYALSYTLVQPAIIRESEISYEFSKRLSEAREKMENSDFTGAVSMIESVRSLSGYEKNEDAIELMAALPIAYKRTTLEGGLRIRAYSISGAIPNTLSITYDDKFLITGDNEGMLHKIDISTGTEISETGTDGSAIMSMAVDYMSKRIFTGTEDGNVLTIDIDTPAQINKFTRHKGPVRAVAITGNGRYAFSAASEHTIRLWDTVEGDYLGRFEECGQQVSALALQKDERVLISGMEDGFVIFWDSAAGKSVKVVPCHNGAVNSIAQSEDGLYALTAAADGVVGLWDIKAMKVLKTYNTGDSNVLSAAFCPGAGGGGKYFACGTMEGTIHFFSVGSEGCLFTLSGHTDGVKAIVFSLNGNYLFSASLDGTIVRWFVEWEISTEENPYGRQMLKQLIAQYLSFVTQDGVDKDMLKQRITAAGLSYLTDEFEPILRQMAQTPRRRPLTRTRLNMEEIAAKLTAVEVKIKEESTWLKKVVIATVVIVVIIIASVIVHTMQTTRYNTSEINKTVKEDIYFKTVYDAVKSMDKHPGGCDASNLDAYKESFAVFIKKYRATVMSLHPKSRENISCLLSLRTDKGVVNNLIAEMAQTEDQGISQALSITLSYMGSDALPSLTELLGSERFAANNEGGARMVALTMAAMATTESINALVDLAISKPYLGGIIVPHLASMFSTKKLEPEQALKFIEALMGNADEKVRKAAVGALIYMKGSKVKGLIEKGIADPSAEVSGEAKRVSALF